MYNDNSYDNQKNNASGKTAPPVRVELTESEFGRLNSLYAGVINKGTEEDQQKAKKLQDKIMKYTREFTDEEGYTKKRVCFFESEAAATIMFLIRDGSSGE